MRRRPLFSLPVHRLHLRPHRRLFQKSGAGAKGTQATGGAPTTWHPPLPATFGGRKQWTPESVHGMRTPAGGAMFAPQRGEPSLTALNLTRRLFVGWKLGWPHLTVFFFFFLAAMRRQLVYVHIRCPQLPPVSRHVGLPECSPVIRPVGVSVGACPERRWWAVAGTLGVSSRIYFVELCAST